MTRSAPVYVFVAIDARAWRERFGAAERERFERSIGRPEFPEDGERAVARFGPLERWSTDLELFRVACGRLGIRMVESIARRQPRSGERNGNARSSPRE